jgi:hypothetical protein
VADFLGVTIVTAVTGLTIQVSSDSLTPLTTSLK